MIIVAVGYYLPVIVSSKKSFMTEELMFPIRRSIVEFKNRENHSTKFGKRKNKQSFYLWKMGETYIKIKGKWHYLYRAIDTDGLTLNIWLRKRRDTQAAYAFLK